MGAILHGYLFESASKTDIKMRSLSKFSITFKVQRLIFKESTPYIKVHYYGSLS